MSLERITTIDAAGVRDGVVVLSIYHFDDWDPVDERVEQLRAKLDAYAVFVRSARFRQTFDTLPAVVELVSRDPVPEDAADLCASFGVHLGAFAPSS